MQGPIFGRSITIPVFRKIPFFQAQSQKLEADSYALTGEYDKAIEGYEEAQEKLKEDLGKEKLQKNVISSITFNASYTHLLAGNLRPALEGISLYAQQSKAEAGGLSEEVAEDIEAFRDEVIVRAINTPEVSSSQDLGGCNGSL